MSLPTPASRDSARTDEIKPALLNLNSKVSVMGLSTMVTIAEASSIAAQHTLLGKIELHESGDRTV